MIPEGFQILCSRGLDGTAKVWNITDNTHPHLLHTFPDLGQSGNVLNLLIANQVLTGNIAVSQNGKYLVVKKGETGIRVFEF